jgi:hypothetical protein
MRPFLLLALGAAVAAAGLASWALFAPETGVTGTAGVVLALVGSLAVGLGVLLLLRPGRRLRRVLVPLVVLAAALTALAGWFLMQWGLAVAMLVALAAVLLAPFVPRPESHRVRRLLPLLAATAAAPALADQRSGAASTGTLAGPSSPTLRR